MPKNEIAHELFSKKVNGNLNEKALTKIKKKKELMEVISINLPTLVDFYFNEVQKKKDMDVYRDQVFKTVTSHKYFYKPVLKMIKTAKKKKWKIPKGLHIILMDSLERMRYKYEKKMREYDNNGQSRSSDMTAELINEIKTKNKQQIQRTLDMADMLVEKQAKYFEDEGITADYADALARCLVPPKYLHERNINIYFRRLNATLIEIQRSGMILENKSDDDEETYVNNVGINLMSKEALSAIYNAFFSGVERKVYLKALTYFLLERKPYKYDSFNKITKGLYAAINEFILEVLEGDRIINLSGKKLDKKDKEKMEISKKELKDIMKDYAKTRFSDVKAGQDSTRRVTITELDPETYPRIHKVFTDSKTDAIEEIAVAEEEKAEQRKNQNQNNNKNNSNNNKNNRNNNKK